MRTILIFIIIPFLSFGQCVDGDLDNDGVCDEIDDCIGTWIIEISTGNCDQFTSQGADACNSYLGCEWTYSWGGWVTGGSSDCLGSYELDNSYCDELELLISGCMDESACNYDELATEDDDSCIYPNVGYDCNGNCLEDLDNDGVCDACETMDYLVDEWCNCDMDLEYAVYYTDIDEVNCVSTQACYCVCNNDGDGDGVCEDYCSLLSVTDVVVDLNMTIDIAIYDGNIGGSPYPYVSYTIDNFGDTIQTGNINSFGNLGLDTSWYEYSLNSLPNYPLTIYYVYGMDADTCVLTYSSTPIGIEEASLEKTLITKLGVLGKGTGNKGLQLHIYNDGSVEKKYVIK